MEHMVQRFLSWKLPENFSPVELAWPPAAPTPADGGNDE